MKLENEFIVGPRRLLACWVSSKINKFSFEASACHPAFTVFTDTFETACIVTLLPGIHSILSFSRNAQIGAVIIQSIAISVVNFTRIIGGETKNEAVQVYNF